MQKTEVLYEFTVGPWYVVENDMVCWLIPIEDWDAITRALGAEPEGATGANSLPPDATAPSRIDMEAERLRLERLGRQIAFYLGTTIIVAVSCAAGWWLEWR